jgi:two-component system, OmpR family, sensor histidine kinase KdpD
VTPDERFRILAEASAALDSVSDVNLGLVKVARLLVPRVADWCAIDVLDPSGQQRRVAQASSPSVSPDVLNMRLRVRGRLLGTLRVAGSGSTAPDRAEFLEFAAALAYRIGLALEMARLARRAEQADHGRDAFLAAASHELRSPLCHLKGFVSTLRRQSALLDDHTRDDFLAEVEREADRLANRIANLLDWSRLVSDGVKPDAQTNAAVATLISGGLQHSSRSLVEHHLRLDVFVQEGLPDLRVDASLAQRLIANLIDNAIACSPQGGRIHVQATLQGGAVVMQIADEGAPVAAADLEQIFEPYLDDPRRTSGARQETGLALAVCRAIADACGGDIRVKNLPPGGVVFTVRLPVPT